jgi:Bacterial PH domain
VTSPKARLDWSPSALLVSVGWVATAGAALFVVFTEDRTGRALVALAAAVVAILALHGTVARPRLTADSGGVTVRSLTRRRNWAWSEVNVRVVRTKRLGREVSTLELDADEDLIVLGWLDLGVAPEDVAEALRDLRT